MTIGFSDLTETDAQRRSPWTTIGWIVASVVVLLIVLEVMSPMCRLPRELRYRANCASNLRQIGESVLLYANENDGHFPPNFVALLETQALVPECFICRSTGSEKATGKTPQEIRDAFAAGGHLDYVWVGAGLDSTAPADTVIAFEALNHQPDDSADTEGMHVVFADGTVRFVDAKEARQIRDPFNLGLRPIRWPRPAPANE